MCLTDIKSGWSHYPVAVLLGAILLSLPGYAASSDMVLKINPGDDAAIQYMPGEITAMLEDLGYVWVPVHDPAVGHGVEVAQLYGQYRM